MRSYSVGSSSGGWVSSVGEVYSAGVFYFERRVGGGGGVV